MEGDDEQRISAHIYELQCRHRALDDALYALEQRAYRDQLQLQRIKKEKLKIKDAIARLKDELIPDLDA